MFSSPTEDSRQPELRARRAHVMNRYLARRKQVETFRVPNARLTSSPSSAAVAVTVAAAAATVASPSTAVAQYKRHEGSLKLRISTVMLSYKRRPKRRL